jgi:biopolymer transport protein ExbB/TolQ
MSVASWYFILSKGWSALRLRRSARTALNAFWSARSLDDAIADEAAEISARIIAGDEAQSRLKAAWSKA